MRMVKIMELIINRKEKQMLARVLSLLNNKELGFKQKLNIIKGRYSTITAGDKVFSIRYNQEAAGAKWYQFELITTPTGECWTINLAVFGKLNEIISLPKEDREDLIIRLLAGGHKGLKHVLFYHSMGFEIKYDIQPLDADDYNKLMQGKLDIYIRTYSTKAG